MHFHTSIRKIRGIYIVRDQVKIFVDGLFDLNSDVDIFSMHVKDFLVSLRVNRYLVNCI